MNRPLIRPLFALLLAAACVPAHAEGLSFRNVTGVGPWIAEQGNQALRDLARELKESLADQLRPVLPEAPAVEAEAATAAATPAVRS